MATTTTTSGLFALDFKDLTKGLLVAIGTSVVTIIENTIQAGSITFDWQKIGLAALAGGLAYLSKNFLTPSQTVSSSPVAK